MAKTKTKTKAKSTTASSGGKTVDKVALVRERIKEAFAQVEENYIIVSELLSAAYHKELFLQWGFEDFKEYCDSDLDIHYRKAMYFVDIWDKVKEFDLDQKKVIGLGWTKMKDICAVMTKRNAAGWMKKAEEMTSRELAEAVKLVRKKDTKGSKDLPTITTMTLRMSESEANIITDAIEEAKKLTESDNAVVALEMICQDWAESQGSTPVRKSIDDHVKYLETVYGVTITVKGKPKVQEAAEEEAEEKPTKAKTKAKAKPKAKAKAKTKAAAKEEEGEESSDQDIDDLLGL